MARFDSIGLWWEDRPPEKPPKKEKQKPVPPKPIWLEPDYLPYIDEARAFEPDLFTDDELTQAWRNKEPLIWDIESYPNYFGLSLMSVVSGKSLVFENDDAGLTFNPVKLKWVLENFPLIDFNGEGYDQWIGALACAGWNYAKLNQATKQIIELGEAPWRVLKNARVKRLQLNHIDLMELTALAPSLKTMAGRLNSPMMMDLPFSPGTTLTADQKLIVKWYNFNDLHNTHLLYKAHKPNIELRESFGPRYNCDLRSKSDAQMAEAMFRAEYERRTGRSVGYSKIEPGKKFRFQVPHYVKFQTPELQHALEVIRNVEFEVSPAGYIPLPAAIKKLKISIGKATYQMGIGGLHSTEKRAAYHVGKDYILRDHDVASYYPKLILATGMEPPLLRGLFRSTYAGWVEFRLQAKRAGDTVSADGFKIVVNGSFGKTLDPFSCLYYPELGIQTTVSGQLSLFMAIERLELAGIQVVNANTDGIVVYCHKSKEHIMKAIFEQWSRETSLEMETTDYMMMFSRDVNSYVAFKHDGKAKQKGVFSIGDIKHNPSNDICAHAIIQYLTKGTPIEKTIRESRDLTKFLEIRKVKGGAAKVWDNGQIEFVGKIARWYHSTDVKGNIVTGDKGHQVPDTVGARPCMRLPDTFPDDIDYEWYIQECYDLLDKIGYNDLVATWGQAA